jgi:ABC-type sugar transport system permease subunit
VKERAMGRRQRLAAMLFILPAALLGAVFLLTPAAIMASTAVRLQSLTAAEAGPYCGGENLRAVLADTDFRNAVRNTSLFTAIVVPAQVALALLLAIWTDGPGWSRRFLRAAVFVPTTISLTVLAVLWKLILAPASASGGGLLNGVLAALHLPPQPFLTSPSQAMACLIAMSIWQGAGFQMMIFLAGLQNIPDELYEAAALDGAGARRRFLHVTLPGIAPTAVLVIMVTTILAFKLFVQPYLMTRGGPQGSTLSIVQYMYRAAFYMRDLGLACATAVVFTAGIAVLTALQWLAARRMEVRA